MNISIAASINNNYWIVANDQTKVYSSAKASYSQLPDPKYDQWIASGFVPSRINSEEELWDVLQVQYPQALVGLNLPIKQKSYNRDTLISKMIGAIADSLIAGKVPTDPLLVDMFVKLQPDIQAARP